jgi:hypothetical protein
MVERINRKRDEVRPRELIVHFSDNVRSAFGDLAAVVHRSEHFDEGMVRIVQEWAGRIDPTVHSFITALPTIADETLRYVIATGDKRAAQAWGEISGQLSEIEGYTITAKERLRIK